MHREEWVSLVVAVAVAAVVYLGLTTLGRRRSQATRSGVADRTLRSEAGVRLSGFAWSLGGFLWSRARVDLILTDDVLLIEPAGPPWFVAYRVGFDAQAAMLRLVLPGLARSVRLIGCEVKDGRLVLHLRPALGGARLSLQVAEPEQWAEQLSARLGESRWSPD